MYVKNLINSSFVDDDVDNQTVLWSEDSPALALCLFPTLLAG